MINWFRKARRGEMEPTLFNTVVATLMIVVILALFIVGVCSARHYSITGVWFDTSIRIVRVEQLSGGVSYNVEKSAFLDKEWYILKSFTVNPTTGDELEAYDDATQYWLRLIETDGRSEVRKVLKKHP